MTTWTRSYDATPEHLGVDASDEETAAYNEVQREKLAERFAADPGREDAKAFIEANWITWLRSTEGA